MTMRLLVTIVLSVVPALGQVASSALLGEVHDESGALLPRVQIMARQELTGFRNNAVTDSAGAYRIDQLSPGRYTVTASLPGFKTLSMDSVVVEVNQKARLDLLLAVGEQNDRVTVIADVSPLQTSDPSMGYRLDFPTITALPLSERNVISLMT